MIKIIKAKSTQLESFWFWPASPFKFAEYCKKEGQSAMDGGLSFVEQGCESKRPGNEVELWNLTKKLRVAGNNVRVPAGQTDWGVFSLVLFLLHGQKKWTRHKGETTS